ncbi:hypothetical protein EUTSA_v10026727mg [Eutrema salsugineum]|uniref:Uncharacterized protein n=1 Tax=Eutrema salsugineum TaxID=72664 RepID=V4LV91_EUTSA|nr:hypothetical protein EUTSA_v10026727mg [Eutrema salsugineum]
MIIDILGRFKGEEEEEMMAETGMVMVGVLGLWARFVRQPVLEFAGEMIQLISEVTLRISRRDTTSHVPLSTTS